MPDSATLFINGHNFTLAGENLVPKGKRGYLRRLRPLQDSEPGIPRTASWPVSGPVGQSREGADGSLGHDHSNLETRFDGLLTSLGAVSTTSLTTYDPLSSSSAKLGAFALGSVALGGGTTLGAPQTISHIQEYVGRLFIGRGAFVSQVNASTFTLEATKTLTAMVYGMALWFRTLRIGMGGTLALQTVTGVTSSASTYTATQVGGSDVLAKEMITANDRLWMVRADPAGTNENRLRFTADDFVSLSTGFIVGDPGIGTTGLGVMGPYNLAANENGVFGYTPEGIPFNIIEALRDARSADNGRKMAYQFGWEYVITSLGLYAIRGQTANPVGIGTDSMSGFEGFDGKPVAVLAWREALCVVYEDSAGSTWRGLWGVFNRNLTRTTGELDWYPFFTRTSAAVRCLGATSTPTLPAIVWGEGPNTLARISKGRAGRDISDASYTYSTGGGQWFGSTMMRQQHLRKTVRWGRFAAENMTAGGSWQLAVAFDGGSYTNIGSAVTANGAAKVVPSTLTSAPTGFTPKPRLTQTTPSTFTNLIPNPSAETGTTSWTGNAGGETISRTTAYAASGSYSFNVVCDGSFTSQGISHVNGTDGVAVSPSTAYTLAVTAVLVSGSGNGQPQIAWFTAAGAFISSSAGTSAALGAATRVSMTATSPSNAAFAAPVFLIATGQPVVTFRVDAWQLETGSSASAYIDGSLGTAYDWTGTAHASSSTFNSAIASPPQVRGFLEIGYDERPDQVTEVAAVLGPVSRAEFTRLRALADADSSDGRQPVEVKLPLDETMYYGYVQTCEEQDLQAGDVMGAAVTLLLVDSA